MLLKSILLILHSGVRFVSRSTPPAGYYLQVHGTPFDLQTGKLNPESSVWFVGGDWEFSKRSDYERDRYMLYYNC